MHVFREVVIERQIIYIFLRYNHGAFKVDPSKVLVVAFGEVERNLQKLPASENLLNFTLAARIAVFARGGKCEKGVSRQYFLTCFRSTISAGDKSIINTPP